MIPTALAMTTLVFLSGEPAKETPRKPNPIAPSLPLLTDKEEERIDRIIDRFIEYDLGRLKGEEAKKAVQDFSRLGPEAIPALIRGLNRAAQIEATCPAVVIAKKLGPMLQASSDLKLLDFARENIGAGVTQTRHAGVLKDLKFALLLRRNAVAKAQASGKTGTSSKPLTSMSVAELAEAAGSERGERLRAVLTELEKRSGAAVVAALGTAAGITYDTEAQQLARELLVRHLSRQPGTFVKDRLKDEKPEVRAAAAKVIGNKGWRLGAELIAALEDPDAEVRQAARQALVQLNRGTDFGPERDASEADRAEAIRKWKAWWAKQGGR